MERLSGDHLGDVLLCARSVNASAGADASTAE